MGNIRRPPSQMQDSLSIPGDEVDRKEGKAILACLQIMRHAHNEKRKWKQNGSQPVVESSQPMSLPYTAQHRTAVFVLPEKIRHYRHQKQEKMASVETPH